MYLKEHHNIVLCICYNCIKLLLYCTLLHEKPINSFTCYVYLLHLDNFMSTLSLWSVLTTTQLFTFHLTWSGKNSGNNCEITAVLAITRSWINFLFFHNMLSTATLINNIFCCSLPTNNYSLTGTINFLPLLR